MRQSLGGNTSSDLGGDLYDVILEQAVSSLAQSTGDDLLGFQMDADAVLDGEEHLIDSSVTRTEDPRCRLVLEASLSPEAGSLQQLEDALWRIWRGLAYGELQATSLRRGSERTELRFLTAVPGSGLCVTGVLRIGGPHYQRLFRKER
jgi:hypothetical protein